MYMYETSRYVQQTAAGCLAFLTFILFHFVMLREITNFPSGQQVRELQVCAERQAEEMVDLHHKQWVKWPNFLTTMFQIGLKLRSPPAGTGLDVFSLHESSSK